ncbi:hypothetical protein HELRODRAFT_134183, partial [Helobdella robusta]|uniref:Uncharacterized protein n=1 Tax=Helobdella robusta TaxID=6412 RepID=T1EI35_HELRO
ESQVKNLLESNYYFEQAGLGLHSADTLKIFLSMKQLAKEKDLQNVRFWGKIYGLEQNYFVVEADYVEGNDEEEEEEVEEELEVGSFLLDNFLSFIKELEEEEEDMDGNFLPLPKINYKPPPNPPKEEPGTGMNKKVYYVCNDPGKLWTKLPMVSPKQIFISRKIKKLFSGRLDAPIVSFPTFPGLEINYLRAQIARISAATHVSPTGYFVTEDEEEEEADGELLTNAEYEALSIKEQFAAGIQGWVHHVPYILPQ